MYLEKHPNQIKSRNRCCLKLNMFQRLVSKDNMVLFILHVSRPAQPLPLPQTTYDGWCGGWLWNGLTSFSLPGNQNEIAHLFCLPSLNLLDSLLMLLLALPLFLTILDPSAFVCHLWVALLCLKKRSGEHRLFCSYLPYLSQVLPDAKRWDYTYVKLASSWLLLSRAISHLYTAFWESYTPDKWMWVSEVLC